MLLRRALHERAEVRRRARVSGMPPASRARAKSSMSSISRFIRLPLDERARGDVAREIVAAVQFEQLRRGDDRAERRAQVVAEHRDEHLVQTERLGALRQLLHQLLLLPVQLEEHLAPCCARMCGSIGL